jgi:hypothetical protein
MASVRYEFGIAVRSDSIQDLLDQIELVGIAGTKVGKILRNRIISDLNFI